MYVVGGDADEESMFKFDSTYGTWSEVAPMPERRRACAACAVGDDIYVFGGRSDDEAYASVFKYDTVADEWSTLTPMPCTCAFHSASVLDGMVYIMGFGYMSSEVLRFDPASGVWSTLAPTLNGHVASTSFVLGGCLNVAGGCNSSGVERYDVATNTWNAMANMLEERYACAAVTIASTGPAKEQDLFDSLIAKASSGRP
jgi:N-acetylneuraminic acid mutarotase